jgi:RNA polymerase sigma-54 factor
LPPVRAAGVDIARRTVAKYREGMRIASLVPRRRDKSAVNGAQVRVRTASASFVSD